MEQAHPERTERIHSDCFQYYFTLEYSSFKFAEFHTIAPPAFVERKDKKLVENAGSDTMDRALSPTRGATTGLPHSL